MNEFHVIFKPKTALVKATRDDSICGYVLIAETDSKEIFRHYHPSKDALCKELNDFIWGLNTIKEAL